MTTMNIENYNQIPALHNSYAVKQINQTKP